MQPGHRDFHFLGATLTFLSASDRSPEPTETVLLVSRSIADEEGIEATEAHQKAMRLAMCNSPCNVRRKILVHK